MPHEQARPNLTTRTLRRLVEFTVDFAAIFKAHRERESMLHVVEDIPYVHNDDSQGSGPNSGGSDEDHWLDVIRMKGSTGVQPALLYIHGGGFAICSKRTHRYFAYQYAKLGFTVFNINYRLMPEHRFPAAAHDAMDAFNWMLDHGSEYGADVSNIVIAGESAGANLAIGIAAAACFEGIEDERAKAIYERNPTIGAVLPACGLLQTSNVARLWRGVPGFPKLAKVLFTGIEKDYLPRPLVGPGKPDLADPLCVYESRSADRDIPPMFAFCGTDDYVYDDSARLARALRRQGADYQLRSYEKANHAFHAIPGSEVGRRCWKDQEQFLRARIEGLAKRKAKDSGYEVPKKEQELRESA